MKRKIFNLFLLTVIAMLLLPICTRAMIIYVEPADEKMFAIEVEPSDTIDALKAKIQDKKDHIPSNQTLVFSGSYMKWDDIASQNIRTNIPDFDTNKNVGKTLEDNRTLADYSIQKEYIISLFLIENDIVVNVNNENYGTASATPNKGAKDTTISLVATPKPGYYFVKWESEDVNITNNEFVMPEKKVAITAVFEKYSYEFLEGNNQELTIDDIKSFSLKIDGDYSLFQSLKVGNLELIKNEDYTVTEGSTVITFTDKGIAKLNTLSKGDHEILVTYTNNKEVKGKVILNSEIENPKTGDNYTTYLITGIISLIGVISISFYTRRKLVK